MYRPIHAIDFRVNVPVYVQNVEPAVVVDIQKPAAPAEQPGIGHEPGGLGVVLKQALAVVVVKVGQIVRKVCLENIQKSVAIVVSGRNPHARLISTVAAGGNTGFQPTFGKCAVPVVPKQETHLAVIGHVDIRPAIVVKIRNQHAKTIAGRSFPDAALLRDIGKGSISIVVKQIVSGPRQSLRARNSPRRPWN